MYVAAGTTVGAGPAGPAPWPGPGGGGEAVVDCLVARRGRLPRDRMNRRLNEAGRFLLIEAAARIYGLSLTAADLARDGHRRWYLPALDLSASVAHCEDHSVVAFAAGAWIGVDLQDERDRPGALLWLGDLLGRPPGQPAVIRDFAECEALIKASHLTKETFAGVRLPAWRPGWRPCGEHHLRSLVLPGGGMHLALAADRPATVRWWWQAERDRTPVPTDALRLERA
ncbi:MAG TPA: hypothetical protein VGX23_12120 [Actinocrinis sp.]|nr:hypothetical protein [Actinocrinis sp.]